MRTISENGNDIPAADALHHAGNGTVAVGENAVLAGQMVNGASGEASIPTFFTAMKTRCVLSYGSAWPSA